MNRELTVDHPAFRAAVADLRTAAEKLRADRDRISHEVRSLLDSGWSGAAASAFGEGWTEWEHAASEVLAGLATMGDLLQATHADLTEADAAAGSDLADISGRIVARLG